MNQPEILYELRKKNALTLDKLAEETGISKNMLWHLEKGDRTGTVETLKKLSNFYNVSLDYITGNIERSALIDDFIKGLVKDGILTNPDNIPPDVEKQILNLIKLKLKNLM
ncbi:MAG: helix-turn-helix domain-containing protein [Clostridium tyrobutyricum]|jgi:transcriptional regulator with XRE-family HTH domain|uniref:helix-turn-helix domain-containing protein n=1 Tax=Clostridium tyrobutyricum TaxID=1519 RepID=UPI002432698F|nr:helix-turn-helix transcriptional regulator [Clostridium tyrobutyricum]MCH4237515.1 helix-turn-helix domain-containing protein [Clostridium tyrobutyricum]MCH4259316.1 helix-turn-helix domain-containing protein [Clostridium tyrobutyricum]